MKYLSTRDDSLQKSFNQILYQGLSKPLSSVSGEPRLLGRPAMGTENATWTSGGFDLETESLPSRAWSSHNWREPFDHAWADWSHCLYGRNEAC